MLTFNKETVKNDEKDDSIDRCNNEDKKLEKALRPFL